MWFFRGFYWFEFRFLIFRLTPLNWNWTFQINFILISLEPRAKKFRELFRNVETFRLRFLRVEAIPMKSPFGDQKPMLKKRGIYCRNLLMIEYVFNLRFRFAEFFYLQELSSYTVEITAKREYHKYIRNAAMRVNLFVRIHAIHSVQLLLLM